MALDFIGKRGQTVGATKEARIKHAREILQKELLPHVGIDDKCETRKAYYLGYMARRLRFSFLRFSYKTRLYAMI